MSYKAEVTTLGDPPDVWSSNALRFPTEAEAHCYAVDLASRWTAVKNRRVTECDDPITARWDIMDGLIHLNA